MDPTDTVEEITQVYTYKSQICSIYYSNCCTLFMIETLEYPSYLQVSFNVVSYRDCREMSTVLEMKIVQLVNVA